MPGVPAAGHITSGGFWHPGAIDTCSKCDTSRTEYASSSYLVLSNRNGVEVTDLHTGETRWLQGDDAATLREDLRKNYHRHLTDRMLSEYFGERSER
jgi:hypothetical protein